MKLKWTVPALRDLEEIGDWIARDNPEAAKRTVNRLLNHAEALLQHADMGRAGRVPGTRELVFADIPYILPYRVRGETVEILAVFHGARRWPESFG